jgi:hypothetical protein
MCTVRNLDAEHASLHFYCVLLVAVQGLFWQFEICLLNLCWAGFLLLTDTADDHAVRELR